MGLGKNLWDNFFVVEQQNIPFDVLKEQAKFLQESTQGRIIGEVISRREFITEFLVEDSRLPSTSDFEDWNKMVHRFILRPANNNYHYELLRVVQDIRYAYPSNIIFDKQEFVISNENELVNTLKSIFSNNLTRNIIHTMMGQYSSAFI